MGSVGAFLSGGRDLELGELERLVDDLAATPEVWRAQVAHHPDRRHYVQLHRDPHVDVWLICWDAAQETGLHDHDRSAGAVRVVEGTLLEDWLAPHGRSISLETRAHHAGSRFSFDATYIHDVRHDGGPPAVSLHAYSPALWRMGYYAIGARGLGRVSLRYLEEEAA
jgi:Cysteine dioxygenase type I